MDVQQRENSLKQIEGMHTIKKFFSLFIHLFDSIYMLKNEIIKKCVLCSLGHGLEFSNLQLFLILSTFKFWVLVLTQMEHSK